MNKNNNASRELKSKRLDECDAEFDTIIAAHQSDYHDPFEFAVAMDIAVPSVTSAARGITINSKYRFDAEVLAWNGQRLWWEFMRKSGGGFCKFNRNVGAFGPYGFMYLKRICLGRENLDAMLCEYANGKPVGERRCGNGKPTRNGKGERALPPGNDDSTQTDYIPGEWPRRTNPMNQLAGRHQELPLMDDPVDPRSTSQAKRKQFRSDEFWEVLESLPEEQLSLLMLKYCDSINLSQLARKLRINRNEFYSRLHKIRQVVRKRLKDLGW